MLRLRETRGASVVYLAARDAARRLGGWFPGGWDATL